MRSKALIFSFLAVAAVSFAAVQDAVQLRLTLTEGDKHEYTVTMTGNNSVEVPSMGAMDMGINGSVTQVVKIGKVDAEKGDAEVEIISSNMKMELTGPMAEMAQMGQDSMPKESSVVGRITNRYRVNDMKMKNVNMQQMLAMSSSMGVQPFIELPEAAVKAGDTWNVVWPKNPMMSDKDATLKATFKGDGELEGKKGNWVTLTGQVPMNVNVGKMMEEMAKQNPGADPTGGMPVMNMTMAGTIDVDMNAVLDKSTGRVLALVSVLKTKSKMELTDMQMTLDSGGTMTVKMVGK